ncbi:MAG: tRNA (adenosine(37)-N6)-threonylcarbamoyltransferase complex dimerization subunit type 1 TsaB [Bacteroidales bacterium]|nr:tRNA (adenosine(37)-N6)-threonylcarbamoyltransferase complex dimerization subunit type 1 TsaB [Bacteroidales bacterium]
MKTILCIETATRPCSVALFVDGNPAFTKEELNGPSHASLLGDFVHEATIYAKENKLSIDAVAVSCGPGSYTGLRIGVALAKGICFGTDIPLIPIQTLPLLASTVITEQQLPADALLCPMIDARRMEVYSGIYSMTLKEIKPVSADIIDEESYMDYRASGELYIFGDGAEKCVDKLGKQVHFLKEIVPLARNMYPLIQKAISEGKVVKDPAYFEPFYLKEFVATVSKKPF